MIVVNDERRFREEYILPIRIVPTESDFLQKAHVRPLSYAGRLVSKLYSRLFRISLELKRDYTTYYQTEYGNFESYLRKRHLLSRDDAAALSARYDRVAAIVRFGRLYSFMEEGAGEELLNKLLDLED
jgi:hypothetical protein